MHALFLVTNWLQRDEFFILDSVCLHDSGEFRVRYRLGQQSTLRLKKELRERGDRVGVYDFGRSLEMLDGQQTLERMNERARSTAESMKFLRGFCGTFNAASGGPKRKRRK